jgi:hypothetical protein
MIRIQGLRKFFWVTGCYKGAPSRSFGLESSGTRLHPLSDPYVFIYFLKLYPISASISRTASSSPTSTAREMMLCPMLSSSIPSIFDTRNTLW